MNREEVQGAIWSRLTDWLPFADAIDEKEIDGKTDRLLSDLEPLLAEIERLRAALLDVERYVERVSAKSANAWDQGHESAIDGCPCRNPNARDCVNPYRQALS